MKKCPFCAEQIQDEAVKCRHCGEYVDGRVRPESIEIGREGDLLVLRKGAGLPDRCVRCNAPANGQILARNLSWHHPALYLLIISPVIYIIVALIVRKTAKVDVGICEMHRGRRRTAIVVSLALYLVATTSCVIGVGQEAEVAMWIALLVFLGAIVYNIVGTRVVSASRIDDRLVWIKGVDPEYLAALPQWASYL